MVKRIFSTACLCLALAACSKVSMVEPVRGSGEETAIGFQFNTGNTLKSYTDMQKTGHYNFGVFAYKSTDKVNSVMPNYLVGYCDGVNGYDLKTGSTWGDQGGLEDGKSYWQYEGLGYAEYHGTYAGKALDDAYKSNNANQYLKYWDNSAANTYFYAYAPYIYNTNPAMQVSYVDGTAQSATGADTYVMTFPNGSLKDGYDDASLLDYMFAYVPVAKADYGHDVSLQFTRLNAKVNIKFWEDVAGYKVRILNLSDTYNKGVYAAASIKEAGAGNYGYKAGKYYTSNGVRIQFPTGGATAGMKQFQGTIATNTTQLTFAAPEDAQIGENRFAASASKTTYYAIPKGGDSDKDGTADQVMSNSSNSFTSATAADADLIKTGFTFHVSYELTAEDTGEKIVVKNATVHVPCEYANWKPNTHYTYIFKITKNSNGTTDPNPDIDPKDPEVPTTPALYPIVFDNCTVVDWDENESEWNISDNEGVIYHDVQLFAEAGCTTPKYSITTGDLYVNVTDNDTYAGHTIDYSAITVTGPAGADMTKVTYSSTDKKITVASGAAAGVYTVTYTCAATYDQTTHPSTWTETFVVGNDYTITTHRDVIGTNSTVAEAKLNVTGTKDSNTETLISANLSIDYPANFDATDKAHVAISGTDVVVKNTAKPGVYKVVYKVGGAKVAEHQFTVVDYSLTLSHTTVFNTVGGTTVTGNQTADANHVYTCTTGSVSGNAITVANNTTEGTYTVTYTVFGTAADKTVYTKTFEVKNTYAVAVNKTSVDRNVGTSTSGGTSTDFITVSTKKNGLATNSDLTSSLKVVDANGADATGFTFTWDGSADTYKLQLINTVPTGNYKVVYTGQSGAEYVVNAGFVVTE